jgi:hypothetical protein
MPAVQFIFIVLTLTLPPALAWGGRRWRHPAYEWTVRRILAVGLLALEGLDHAAKIGDGTFTLQHALPLQLCDWALFAVAAALLFRSSLAFDLAYFWGLAGTLQALFTPAVGSDLALWRLAGFFGLHAGIVISVHCFASSSGANFIWSSPWRPIRPSMQTMDFSAGSRRLAHCSIFFRMILDCTSCNLKASRFSSFQCSMRLGRSQISFAAGILHKPPSAAVLLLCAECGRLSVGGGRFNDGSNARQ